LVADSVFHCQQAIEKALKGYLCWHNISFRKTHSLEELGEQCLDIDSTLLELLDQAIPLTEYAWKFRYPGEPEEPTLDETHESLAITRAVYQAIISRLPEEVRP
jgi:HEPN domain-containing protein